VVGQGRQEKLDRLIGEVSRGERTLAGIGDPELRESVRIALRLHEDGEGLQAPDDFARLRMRARVMSGLRPKAPTLRDNAWTALWYLSRPAPYIVRAIALTAILVGAGMGATLASADSLPDDALYPVKVAAEGVRLALAGAPQDRAAVELSIAEHRLAEAEKLAMSGRTSDALVASAVYSAHIAAAAAELWGDDDAGVGAQLAASFNVQRDRAQRLSIELASGATSSRAAQVLAMIAAPTMAPGLTEVERVAETAASLAVDFADAAEDEASAYDEERSDAAEAPGSIESPLRTGAPQQSAPARANVPGTTAHVSGDAKPKTTATARPSTSTSASGARASTNAKAARKAAEDARAAAEKLKQALQKAKDKREHR
jgi:hypothetical protein